MSESVQWCLGLVFCVFVWTWSAAALLLMLGAWGWAVYAVFCGTRDFIRRIFHAG